MTLFKTWKKQKLVLGEVEPTYRVKYLGNVQTGFMRGDGCVDKPTGVLWNNYSKNGQSVGLDMTLTICGSGMKALTREQGLTEYRAHRISYCIAHPKYPRLFVWVYRHEGKKMKVELRCHAVFCKSEAKAKLMAVQLHDKLTFALNEFMREKTRKQNSRLALQRANALSSSVSVISGAALRNKFLSTAQNFKPSVQNSAGAPKLGAITENSEEEEQQEVDRDDDLLEEEEGDEQDDGTVEDETEESMNGDSDIRFVYYGFIMCVLSIYGMCVCICVWGEVMV